MNLVLKEVKPSSVHEGHAYTYTGICEKDGKEIYVGENTLFEKSKVGEKLDVQLCAWGEIVEKIDEIEDMKDEVSFLKEGDKIRVKAQFKIAD